MSGGVRPAVPADLRAVRRTVEAAYRPWVQVIGTRPRPMDADYTALIEAGAVFVIDPAFDAAPTGTPRTAAALVVLVPEDGALLIENVAVHPSWQGHGLGRRLLDFAEDRARSLAVPEVRLYTNVKMTSNIALYESLGYRRVDHGEPAVPVVVHMRKTVPAPPEPTLP